MKAVNVSYSQNPVCKSLAVPEITDPFRFGTGMTDPVWKNAVHADDFVSFPEGNRINARSAFSAFRTRESFVIGFFFEERPEDRIRQSGSTDGTDVWHGDLAEIHFGDMEPEPWLLQLCVGISGGRFDSSGNYDRWEANVFENETGWGAEVKLPLSMLQLTEAAFRFNLCRQSLGKNIFSTWSPLQLRFHEVENFGMLLFTDYLSAFRLRGGITEKNSLNRTEFEELCNTIRFPAHKVVHGPYLSNPDAGSVCITWETAGRVPAFLEYGRKGVAGERKRVLCGKQGGILCHDTIHFIRLNDLQPETEYEYELFYLTPVKNEVQASGIVRSFRTLPEKGTGFSFFCISDLHSNTGFLRTAWDTPEAGSAAFHVLLGDNLSHAAGREALYAGIIDPIVSQNKKSSLDKPLVFVRGNHDQIGVYAAEFFNVMRHDSGRTFYPFRCGNAFFLVIDTGNPENILPEHSIFTNTELLHQEQEFLEKTVHSESYRNADFRILLGHIPPIDQDAMGTMLHELFRPFRTAEIPPDLLLTGHFHKYLRLPANSPDPAVWGPEWKRHPKFTPCPCPVVVSSIDTLLSCAVSSDTIEVKVLKPGGVQPMDSVTIPKRQTAR